MSIWDRVQQKQAKMTDSEKDEYINSKGHLLDAVQFQQAKDNIEFFQMAADDDKNLNLNNLVNLLEMIDTGKKQPIYNVAVYMFWRSYIYSEVGRKLGKTEYEDFSTDFLIKVMLLCEEARNA